MKKLIACVLSLSIASTLCTNTVCAAGLDKVESLPDGRKVVYVSSENVEGYKNQLLQSAKSNQIADSLNLIMPYFTLTAFISSVGWIVFNVFFEKNGIDCCLESQNFNVASAENHELSNAMQAEEKIGLIKSLAQKFKRKYHYTGGTISSKKQKSLIGTAFLLSIPIALLSFFFGTILPNIVREHYKGIDDHGRNMILNSITDDYSKNCGMKVTFDKNNKFYSIGPQNCDKY